MKYFYFYSLKKITDINVLKWDIEAFSQVRLDFLMQITILKVTEMVMHVQYCITYFSIFMMYIVMLYSHTQLSIHLFTC